MNLYPGQDELCTVTSPIDHFDVMDISNGVSLIIFSHRKDVCVMLTSSGDCIHPKGFILYLALSRILMNTRSDYNSSV